MDFIRVATPVDGANALQARLIRELEDGNQVLWLVCGGSNIATIAQIMANIPENLTSRMIIGLTDERFGPVGHADSNWQQLDEAGFDAKLATRISVLTGDDSMQGTAEAYAAALRTVFATTDVVIGLFGMGADGHIAGILPFSEAAADESLVAAYNTDTYDRITCTFDAIQHCDVAYVFAYGDSKKLALQNLEIELSLDEQPAQILKQLSEAYVYNDQIGGTS